MHAEALWKDEHGRFLSRSGPLIYLHVGFFDGMPIGLNIGSSAAKVLANALTATADQIETEFTHRCQCGEVIESDDDACADCCAKTRRQMRARLRAMNGLENRS